MQIEQNGSCGLIITGNIKTIGDFGAIRTSILDCIGNDCERIHLDIPDSLSMTSSVIGFLLKVIHQDGIRITMTVHDERLYSLLEDLNLIKVFNVSKK